MTDEGARYPGSWPGIVTDNKDPLKLGRVKIMVPALSTEFSLEWAIPMTWYAGKGYGGYWPPEINDAVQVMFLNENPEVPMYLGSYFANPGGVPDTPTAFQREEPTNRGFRSKSGHMIEFDDAEDTLSLRLTSATGFKVWLDDKQKRILLQTPTGHTLELDDTNGSFDFHVQGDRTEMVTGNDMKTVQGNLDENVGGNSTETVSGNKTLTASMIYLNGQASGVTTMNGHQGVVDFITGVPIQPSQTVFADV